ncbi:MAG: histidine kinase [Chitinophagaceae bacterium]
MNWRSLIVKYKLQHIAGWLLLYAAWYYFRYEDYPGRAWLITLIKVADLMIMVYITNYLLVPYLLYKKKYLLFTLLYICMITGFSILKMSAEAAAFGTPGFFDLSSRFKARIYDNILPHFLLVSTAAAFKLLLDYATAQKRLGLLAKEKSATELQFLKSQINPHFLFNSLNAIYFLIEKKNTEARQTLLQFSDLLRYQLYDCNEDSIAIEKELVYLNNYVRLQQLRKDNHYEIKLAINPSVSGFSITPLLLIAFVENAFKHVSNHTKKTNFVLISMSKENNLFFFEAANSTDNSAPTDTVGGIGLANVKRRLALIYPGKHSLTVSNKEDVFNIQLQLTIDQ